MSGTGGIAVTHCAGSVASAAAFPPPGAAKPGRSCFSGPSRFHSCAARTPSGAHGLASSTGKHPPTLPQRASGSARRESVRQSFPRDLESCTTLLPPATASRRQAAISAADPHSVKSAAEPTRAQRFAEVHCRAGGGAGAGPGGQGGRGGCGVGDGVQPSTTVGRQPEVLPDCAVNSHTASSRQ